MCGEEAFDNKTELTTVPTSSDIGEAAADAEGVWSLAVRGGGYSDDGYNRRRSSHRGACRDSSGTDT
jgi:hypothetical protein